MSILEAQEYVFRERTRWLSVPPRIPDDDLMRRRERLLNGFAKTFGFAALISFFIAGEWGFAGWYIAVAGTAIAARQSSKEADHCRDVRQFLQQAGVHNLDELQVGT